MNATPESDISMHRLTIDDSRLTICRRDALVHRASFRSRAARRNSIVNRQSSIVNSRACRRSGFTLIETIIAIVVLSIAVPPMMWSIREAHIQRVGPMLASKARWLATEKLEDIIADRHSTTRGYAYLTSANFPAEASITGSPGFTRTAAFTETAADLSTAGTGYKTCTVTVSWTDGAGVARSLSISTVVTDYT